MGAWRRPAIAAPSRQSAAVFAVAAAASLSVGWLVANGHAAAGIGTAAALTVALVLARAGIAVFIAVVLILTLDGVPGVNLSQLHVAGSFNPSDAGAAILIAIGAARLLFRTGAPIGRPARWLAWWAVLFLGWWALTWFRAVSRGVPPLQAATFGQDFLLFGLLVPLAPWLVKNRSEAIRLLIVVGAATVAFALGDVAASLGGISPTLLTPLFSTSLGPLTRIYTPMSDLISLTLAGALGLALVVRGRLRTVAIGAAVVTLAATALALTRAEYLGLLVGLVAGVGAAFIGGPAWLRRRLGRRSVVLIAGVALTGGLSVALVPALFDSGSVQAVASRLNSGFSALVGGSQTAAASTFTYRQGVDQLMLNVLGSHWPFGLGFLHPSSIYFANLPGGTIRNADTGVFNAFMTMGALGTLLLYAPIGYLCVVVSRPWRRERDEARAALTFGLLIWIGATVFASITLVTLFSITGLVLTAVVIGLAVRLVSAMPSETLAVAAAERELGQ